MAWLIDRIQAQRPRSAQGLRRAASAVIATQSAEAIIATKDEIALAAWTRSAVSAIPRQAALLTPSSLGGAKALQGEPSSPESPDGIARGIAVHSLLQHFPNQPRNAWMQLAAHLVADADLRPEVVAEVIAILDRPELAPVFAPGTLAEVAVTGALGDVRLFGVIDRLIIGPQAVLAVDYKSNWIIPNSAQQVPEGLIRQLGAYRHMLSQLYPDRRIDTAILWTRGATLMPVSDDIVRAALQRATRDSGHAP